MHIVLLEPEIPQNAGNIARTCAVTNSVLHLIKPLGFSVEDKYLKRAGLDYWKLLDIRYYENFGDFCEKNPNAKIWMASTKARHIYADVESHFILRPFLCLLAFLLSAYPPSGVHPLAFPPPAFPPQGAQGVRSQGMRQMP